MAADFAAELARSSSLQAAHEQSQANLRHDYAEALLNIEKLYKRSNEQVLDAVKTRLQKTKWMDSVPDRHATLEEISTVLMSEQEQARTAHDHSIKKLRDAVDAFSKGMTDMHQESEHMERDHMKDKLQDSRLAAQEEVEIAKRKQGYELGEKMRQMEEKYLEEIERLKALMAEEIEKRDLELEGLKLTLSKQTKELAALKKEYEALKLASAKSEEEIERLRELTKDQETEIADLKLEIQRMAEMRDGFDDIMRKVEERISKILNEARRAVRKAHDVVPQPQEVMDRLDAAEEGPVMKAVHNAVDSLIRDREAALEKMQVLQDKLNKVNEEHARAMADLQRQLEAATKQIEHLRATSGSRMLELEDKISELEARIVTLTEDKLALTVALDGTVKKVNEQHRQIMGTQQEQEKYLTKYRQRIAELEAGVNERKRLELQMVAENRKTSELRHLSRLCTRLLRDKDEKSSELADAISRAQTAATSFTISGAGHTSSPGVPHAESGMFGFSPDPSLLGAIRGVVSSVPSTASTGRRPRTAEGRIGGGRGGGMDPSLRADLAAMGLVDHSARGRQPKTLPAV